MGKRVPTGRTSTACRLQRLQRVPSVPFMRYDAYENLVAPARPSAALQLLAGGIILTVLIYYTLNYLLWMVVLAVLPADMGSGLLTNLGSSRTPLEVIVSLFLFGLLSVAIHMTLRILHQRDLRTLIGPVHHAAAQFRRVVVALALLFLIVLLLPMPEDLSPVPNLTFTRWIVLLPLTVLALLIQTSAEELAFRGYIQSQLAARFPNPLIWIGVPSLLFGLVHYDPDLPTLNAMVIIAWATLFGAAAADLTARSGTLGPAIALHMVNNFNAIAIAAPDGPFDGVALFTYPFSLASSDALFIWAPVDLMILFCAWLAARLALRR